uniref:Uncharacterized protein n=1 Tax=Branchiostoma floridae TaxID=7739 RepID=C3ZZN8_BRAFL|eukprot:XP_002585982.1 hypothetical protein BRAFLDRAFT_110252 [Branchiostoma floridae]
MTLAAYQTNGTRYGITQKVFHQLFKECEGCHNSDVSVERSVGNSTARGDLSNNEGSSGSSSNENDDDISSKEDGDSESSTPKFNLFTQFGLTTRGRSSSPLKRGRRLSNNDYQAYKVPHDQLDAHIEDISKQYSVHLKVIKGLNERTCKSADGTVYQATEKVLACHRSGAPTRKRTIKRKRQASKKVGCKFRVRAVVPADTTLPVQIYLHGMHTNHTPGSAEDQRWLPVDERVQCIATDCLDAGLSIQKTVNIIQTALTSGTVGEVDRCRYRELPTRKELVCLQYERRRQNRLTDNDWLSTYQKLEEYQAQGKCLFFQKYDDKENRPFVAVLQTEWQQKMAERFSPNSAWSVDSTFGLNTFGFPLYAATVPNQNGEGIPIFFLLTSAENGPQEEIGLEAGFKAVFQKLQVRPNAIVIDKSLTEKKGIWNAVKDDPLSWEGGQQVKRRMLLCWFHTKKAWTENLLPRLPVDVAAQVYDRLCTVMMATTWEKYEEEKEQLIADFKPQSKVIVQYLKGWDCEEWLSMWVRAGRMFPHGNQDTTNLVEREWMTIKYTILDGKANHRVDRLLDALIGHPRNGNFDGGQTTVAFHEKKNNMRLPLASTPNKLPKQSVDAMNSLNYTSLRTSETDPSSSL